MSFQTSGQRLLVLGAAITLALPGTGGCSDSQPANCQAPNCPPTYVIDDFICIAGGCGAKITRENCAQCGPVLVKYSTVDITAKAGVDYVGVQSGRVLFPKDAKSVTITIKTLPRQAAAPPATFRVVLSVDDAVVGSGVGTISDR
jgi:hypothetical protein